MDTATDFDWASSTFLNFGPSNSPFPSPGGLEKWTTFDSFNSLPASTQPSNLTIPQSTLVTESSIARHGQITPPDDRSPTDAIKGREYREGSIPVEQLHNEVLWPSDQLLSAISPQPETAPQTLSPPQLSSPQHTPPVEETNARPNKRRRTTKKQQEAEQPTPSTSGSGDGETHKPVKRGRGRPKNPPPPPISGDDEMGNSASSTRQTHLEKNRVAAHKCRQRKKEFINDLEARASEHSTKNQVLKEQVVLLREELLELKNMVLAHANCGFWPLDQYLARCAGDLVDRGGGDQPGFHSGFAKTPNQEYTPRGSASHPIGIQSPDPIIPSTETAQGEPEMQNNKDYQEATDSPMNSTGVIEDEYKGLELLKDYEEPTTSA